MGVGGWTDSDERFMQQALDEARAAATAGEVPVGAVLCRSGKAVASGQNRNVRDNDPTAHAEIVAVRAAAQLAGNHRLPAAELFVTLEPCAMCMGALLQARIGRVVFAAYDERAGAAGSVLDLSAVPEFNHRVEINGGLLVNDAGVLLAEFFASRR